MRTHLGFAEELEGFDAPAGEVHREADEEANRGDAGPREVDTRDAESGEDGCDAVVEDPEAGVGVVDLDRAGEQEDCAEDGVCDSHRSSIDVILVISSIEPPPRTAQARRIPSAPIIDVDPRPGEIVDKFHITYRVNKGPSPSSVE